MSAHISKLQVKAREDTGNCGSFLKPQRTAMIYNYLNKDIHPNISQAVPLSGNELFKYLVAFGIHSYSSHHIGYSNKSLEDEVYILPAASRPAGGGEA